ncbi:hypothetical protein, partial [Mycolicibacter minnesotensis]
MLIIALVLAAIGLAALVFAVVTSNALVAWVCIGASALGVLLLIADALRERRALQRAVAGANPQDAEDAEDSANSEDSEDSEDVETLDDSEGLEVAEEVAPAEVADGAADADGLDDAVESGSPEESVDAAQPTLAELIEEATEAAETADKSAPHPD